MGIWGGGKRESGSFWKGGVEKGGGGLGGGMEMECLGSAIELRKGRVFMMM